MSRFWNTEKPVQHPTYMLRIYKGTPSDLYNSIQALANKNNREYHLKVFRVANKRKYLCYETQEKGDEFRITDDIIALFDLRNISSLETSVFFPRVSKQNPRIGTLKNAYGFKSIEAKSTNL